jgi:hypothetical protein
MQKDIAIEEDNITNALTLGHKEAKNSLLRVLIRVERFIKKSKLQTTSICVNGRIGVTTFIISVTSIGYIHISYHISSFKRLANEFSKNHKTLSHFFLCIF